MPSDVTYLEKVRRVPWWIASCALNSFYCQVTFGGTVFVLFLSDLQFEKAQIGLLQSLLPYCGLVALVCARYVARFGAKRVYVTFWMVRKFVLLALVAAPWLLAEYGVRVAFGYVFGVVLVFAFCRSTAEAGVYPWIQEFIPNSIRGRVGGITNIWSALAAATGVAVASYVLAHVTGLARYQWLIVGGTLFGVASAACCIFLPGGRPQELVAAQSHSLWREAREALRDRNFVAYLLGVSCSTLAVAPLAVFLPLFLREHIGLADGNIVLLDGASLGGLLMSTYLWGWAADRYGSRPVLITALLLLAMIPLGWHMVPVHSPWSGQLAMGMAFCAGVVAVGVNTGSSLLLFNHVVPPELSTQRMAVYCAWSGIMGGTGPLLAGWLLDTLRRVQPSWLPAPGELPAESLLPQLSLYSPLLVSCSCCALLAAWLYGRVQVHQQLGTRSFMAMFFQGNPLAAAGTLLRFQRETAEDERITLAQELGETRSPLNSNELLEALHDPSFNVRFEAVVSIARGRPQPELVAALGEVLLRDDPELSAVAAWALGRLGQPEAIAALRQGLHSRYPAVQVRSARALGLLGDADSLPLLRERLADPQQGHARGAYAAAVAALHDEASLPLLLDLLAGAEGDTGMELALAIARLAGHEGDFIRQWRRYRQDPGTALAELLLDRRRQFERHPAFQAAVEAFSHGRLPLGHEALLAIAAALPPDYLAPPARLVAATIVARARRGAVPPEHYLLLLHAMVQRQSE